MKTILSIVPRLPPVVDGVGDYAHLLSANLADRQGILTKFIACDPFKPVVKNHYAPYLDATGKDLSPIQLPHRSKDALLDLLDRCADIDIILLHYVGYGYARRGCPLWLIAALTKWRQANSSRRLVTMFHEVYAKSYQPWSSQFWTSPIQQQIAKDLVNLSDAVVTSSKLYTDMIGKLSVKHEGKIEILPIFSTIGECLSPLPLTKRHPWLVTFGNAKLRKSIYTDSLEQLTTICQQLDIQEIYDIGHNSSDIIRSIPSVKVNAMGVLPATEISHIFNQARVGFINYSIPHIAKSTIFAAYCSHQLLSVFDRRNLGYNLDGVKLDRHYWSVRNTGDFLDLDTAQSIACNAYQWYSQHDITSVTSRVAISLSGIQQQ